MAVKLVDGGGAGGGAITGLSGSQQPKWRGFGGLPYANVRGNHGDHFLRAGDRLGGFLGPATASDAAVDDPVVGATIGTIGTIAPTYEAPAARLVRQEGPRLADTAVQYAAYGAPIAQVYGVTRLAGTVLDAGPLVETVVVETATEGSVTTETIVYLYHRTIALGLCAGPAWVRRIWADTEPIFDFSSGVLWAKYPGVPSAIYPGDELQGADPVLAALHPAGTTPAYRGLCYAVFADLPLRHFDNRVPALSFEVVWDFGGL